MNEVLHKAFYYIDEINRQDPNLESNGNKLVPKALLYGERMSQRLADFLPHASLSLQIAARAQHIKRWAITRDTFPVGRSGYLAWRKALGVMHAELAMCIARRVALNETDIMAIGKMLRKEQIKRDSLVQSLEDVACLVFLEYYFTPFCEKHSDEKVIGIIQKTWKKMSGEAQQAALSLSFSAPQLQLIKQALA